MRERDEMIRAAALGDRRRSRGSSTSSAEDAPPGPAAAEPQNALPPPLQPPAEPNRNRDGLANPIPRVALVAAEILVDDMEETFFKQCSWIRGLNLGVHELKIVRKNFLTDYVLSLTRPSEYPPLLVGFPIGLQTVLPTIWRRKFLDTDGRDRAPNAPLAINASSDDEQDFRASTPQR